MRVGRVIHLNSASWKDYNELAKLCAEKGWEIVACERTRHLGGLSFKFSSEDDYEDYMKKDFSERIKIKQDEPSLASKIVMEYAVVMKKVKEGKNS